MVSITRILSAVFVCFVALAPASSNAVQCGERVRKSWSRMTQQEKDAYKGAVTSAMKNKEFFEFAKLHVDTMSERQAHSTCTFLVWHKRYLLAYENMLRGQGDQYACVTVPYWDCMSEYADMIDGKCSGVQECASIVRDYSGSELDSTPERELTFNGDAVRGSCYPLFAGRSFCDDGDNCGCVPRSDLRNLRYPSTCDYAGVFNDIAYSRSFEEFAYNVQGGVHNEIHNAVGGVMATFSSPNDPLFWNWHATIDMLMYTYHQCHVSSATSLDEALRTVYGFKAGGACSAADTNVVQQAAQTAAQNNKLIGKYFKGLSDKVVDYIAFEGLGQFSYRYQLSDAMRVQLLQSEDMCPVFVKDMKNNTPAPSSPAPSPTSAPNPTPTPTSTPRPTTVAPSPTPTPTQRTPTPTPTQRTPKPTPTQRNPTPTPTPTSTQRPTTSSPSPTPSSTRDVPSPTPSGASDSGSTGGNSPSSASGSEADAPTPLPTSSTGTVRPGGNDGSASTGTESKDDAGKRRNCSVEWLHKDEKTFLSEQNSTYWDWYAKSRNMLKQVLPGDVPKISIQMQELSCTCFQKEFGIAEFSEEFKKNFMLKEGHDRPKCLQTVEDIQQGKKELLLQAESFQPQAVQVKPGVTPAPAVDPKEAYERFHSTKAEHSAKDADQVRQSTSSMASRTVIFNSFVLLVAAFSSLFVNAN